MRPHLNPLFCSRRNKRHESVDSLLTTCDRSARRKCVLQPRYLVAAVFEINRHQFFAALGECEKLKIRGSVIEPSHALRGRPSHACRHDDFEAAKVAPSIAVLTTVVEPENAQSKNAVHCHARLSVADADHCFGSGAAKQMSAHVGWPEAVLEVH